MMFFLLFRGGLVEALSKLTAHEKSDLAFWKHGISKLTTSEAYLGRWWTSMMKLFAKIIQNLFTIFAKHFDHRCLKGSWVHLCFLSLLKFTVCSGCFFGNIVALNVLFKISMLSHYFCRRRCGVSNLNSNYRGHIVVNAIPSFK